MNSKFKKLYETLRPNKYRNTEKDAFIQWSIYGLCNVFALKTIAKHDKIFILTEMHTPKYNLNSDWDIIHVIVKHGSTYYDAKSCYPSLQLAIEKNKNNREIDYLETDKLGFEKAQLPIFDHGFWKINEFIDDKLCDHEFDKDFEILDNQQIRQEFIDFLTNEYYAWIPNRYAQLIQNCYRPIKKESTLC